MANVRPGMLAITVSAKKPHLNGLLVEVLYETPSVAFVLPDGYPAVANDLGCLAWVVKFLTTDVRVQMTWGDSRMARYASCADAALRPLPDPGEEPVHIECTADHSDVAT